MVANDSLKQRGIKWEIIIEIAKIIANDRLTQYGTKWEILSDNVKKHYLEQALDVINIIQKEDGDSSQD